MRRPLALGLLAAAWLAGAPASAQDTPGTDTASSAVPAEPAAATPRQKTRRERENAEVIRLAEQESGALELPGDEPAGRQGKSLGAAIVQMVIVLGGVVLLVYLLLGKLLPKLLRVPTPGGRPRLMRIVDRLPIDQKKSLIIVAIGEDYFLVSAADGGMELISRLDADTVRRAEATAGPDRGGLGRFTEALAGRSSKEP